MSDPIPFNQRWSARITAGVVEYNQVVPPTRRSAQQLLSGCHGGDITLGRGEGYPPRALSGGNVSSGAAVTSPSPLLGNGGRISL